MGMTIVNTDDPKMGVLLMIQQLQGFLKDYEVALQEEGNPSILDEIDRAIGQHQTNIEDIQASRQHQESFRSASLAYGKLKFKVAPLRECYGRDAGDS